MCVVEYGVSGCREILIMDTESNSDIDGDANGGGVKGEGALKLYAHYYVV